MRHSQGCAGSFCTLALLLLAGLAAQHGCHVACFKVSARSGSGEPGDEQQLHFADVQQSAPKQHKRLHRKRSLRLSQQSRQQEEGLVRAFMPEENAAHASSVTGGSSGSRKKSGSPGEDLRATIFGKERAGSSSQARKPALAGMHEQDREAAPARRRETKQKRATVVAAEDLVDDPLNDDEGFLQRVASLKNAARQASDEDRPSSTQKRRRAAAQKEALAGTWDPDQEAPEQEQGEEGASNDAEVRSALDERLHRSLEEILARHEVEDEPASAEPAPEAAGEGGSEVQQPPPEAAGEGSGEEEDEEVAKVGGADEGGPKAQDAMAGIDKVLEELSQGDGKEAEGSSDAAPSVVEEVCMRAFPVLVSEMHDLQACARMHRLRCPSRTVLGSGAMAACMAGFACPGLESEALLSENRHPHVTSMQTRGGVLLLTLGV